MLDKYALWKKAVMLLGLIAVFVFSGCGKMSTTKKIAGVSDLNSREYVIGGETGTIALSSAKKAFPLAQFAEFTAPGDIYTALSSGRVTAMVYDRPSLEYAELKRPDLLILPEELAVGHISVAAPLKNRELIGKVNAFIRQYRAEGTYRAMYDRWVKSKDSVMPKIPEPSRPDGTIVIGADCSNEPMGFVGQDGVVLGFDMEFIKRLSLFLNLKCEVKFMEYQALFPACSSGKIDLAVAQMDATPERKETLLFSDPYIDSPVAVMIRRADYGESPASLQSFNRPDRVIGVWQGTTAMTAVEQKLQHAKIQYFNMTPLEALKSGRIDAFAFDSFYLNDVAKRNPDFAVFPGTLAPEQIVVATAKKNTELIATVNRFIRQYRSDGTYREMHKRWFDSEDEPELPEIPIPSLHAETLTVGIAAETEPTCFIGKKGKPTGFDIEFAMRLGLFLNRKVRFEQMSYDGLIASGTSGKIDLVIASLNATPERRESLAMSDSYLDSEVVLLVRKDDVPVLDGEIRSVADLKGKRASVKTGSVTQELTQRHVSGVEYFSYTDHPTAIQALLAGKVDAALADGPVLRIWAERYPDKLRLAEIYEKARYGFAFKKGSPLTAKVNECLHRLKNSGELQKITAKWCESNPDGKKLEKWTHCADYDGSAGTLRYASDPTKEPMCHLGPDGHYAGLDVELMNRIAYDLNMKLDFVPMNFGALLESVMSGKVDVASGGMYITPERQEKVDFSIPYYEGGLSILARQEKNSAHSTVISSLAQLAGHRVGIMTGTTNDMLTRKYLPQSRPVYFNMFNDQVIALESGKIDAFLMEEPQARVLLRTRPGLERLKENVADNDYGFFFSRQSQALRDAFSDEIKRMKTDGTLQKLERKWFVSDEKEQVMSKPGPGAKGTLTFVTVPQFEPFSFVRDGQIVGFDIEVAMLAAEKLGYSIKPMPMEFGGFIEAVVSGKGDMGGGCITITEERKQQVLFTEPDYQGGIVAIVRRENRNSTPGFRDWLSNIGKELTASFDRTFLRENRWKLILQGLKITVLITVLAAMFGTILAFPVCMMRRSLHWLGRTLGKCYISLMQGTPVLVILMILYYVIFAEIDLNAVLVAVIGFGLNFSAYVAEMLRTGIEGIPKGQSEAALALGFSRLAVFRNVILPQAVRSILPVYRGEFINVLKMTSIVGYIAIQDLTKMSDIIRSRTYEAFFPLIATAAIYFAAAWLLAMGLSLLEYRLDPNRRRKLRKEEDAK